MGNLDDNDYELARQQGIGSDSREVRDVFGYLGELFSKLSTDAGNLINLQVELLKAELRESTAIMARNSVLILAGAVVGAITLAVITLAIIGFIATALPFESDIMAWAVSALIVGVVYALIAGGLVFAGIKNFKERNMAPTRSIEEIKRDKEWVKEIKS